MSYNIYKPFVGPIEVGDFGTAPCTCCKKPFKVKSAWQRSSRRKYCDTPLCQLFKEKKLYTLPPDEQRAKKKEIAAKLKSGEMKSTPKWARCLEFAEREATPRIAARSAIP